MLVAKPTFHGFILASPRVFESCDLTTKVPLSAVGGTAQQLRIEGGKSLGTMQHVDRLVVDIDISNSLSYLF